MPIAAETIYDLIRELGTETCAAYTECFKKIGEAKLKRRGFDPKTLRVINLQLRESEHLPKDKFWVADDGCGNYYFVEPGDRRGAVALWSHDPPGIELVGSDLLEFLESAESENPVVTRAERGDAYISRTKVPGESILDPITMDQGLQFVREHPALTYSGTLTVRSPLDGEEMHLDCPGLAHGFVGDRKVRLQLQHGRIRADRLFDDAKPLIEEIAAALGCHVMFGPRG